jgi:hypothetical protein
MELSYNYENSEDRWIFALNKQTVEVYCDGEKRTYKIPEPIVNFVPRDEYVRIYVSDQLINFYQFKFESDKFLVVDKFDSNGEHISECDSHVFGDWPQYWPQ